MALLVHCENGWGGVIGGAYRRCPGLAELLKPIPKNMKFGLIALGSTCHIMLMLMLEIGAEELGLGSRCSWSSGLAKQET